MLMLRICHVFRYLLDTIHEQEKAGKGKSATSYGEHKIIKGPSNANALPNNKETPMELGVEEEPAKVRRSSNLALDVISEAPENGRIDEEEMSQVYNLLNFGKFGFLVSLLLFNAKVISSTKLLIIMLSLRNHLPCTQN